jgi:predicted small secreted protein
MKRLSLLMLAVLFLMISTLGCNTLKGAGKDISDTGKHIEDVGK